MSQPGKNNDSVASWVFLGVCCMGIMGFMLWLVASHLIVYYLTPIVDAMAFPWRLLPASMTGNIVPDLDFNYLLFRRKPHLIGIIDWVSYVNTALRPWSVAFAGLGVLMLMRQSRHIKEIRVNQRLTPTQLAKNMMSVFTEIAPVVAIQEKIVKNQVKGWARQVFPEEFLKKARYQGKPVLVPDPEKGGLMVDRSRLEGFLQQTSTYSHNGKKLLVSKHLGRQIVDIQSDAAELAKGGSSLVFMDRLSDAGKAIYAILAPYAFNGSKGKVQSKKVSDALNMSSYGSESGKANLSIPEAQESFELWRTHPLAKKLAKMHPWEHTFLFALLEHAQESGKIGTWSFIWLKPTDRMMFYALNTVGRKTPHSEAGLTFSQLQFERKAAQHGYLPLQADGRPRIFTRRVIDALVEEWEFWRHAEEDTTSWWKSDKKNNWDQDDSLISGLAALNNPVPVPPNAQ